MTLIYACIAFGGLGLVGLTILLRHVRKTRELKMRHDLELARSLERSING